MAWVATAIAVSTAWQIYQYNNAPNAPGQQSYSPSNSITYGPDGTITNENLWVPDDSPAGGHNESRTFEGYGKEPEKPKKFDQSPPDPRKYDVQGDSGADAGAATPGVRGEDNPAYKEALDKYNKDKATFDSSQTEWETTHAEWQANKDKFDQQQAKLDMLEGQSLDRLNKGVDEILKESAIQDQKTAFAESQNAMLDPQVAKERQTMAETQMARGQTGSRAAVDSGATLDKAVLDTKAEINRQASMYAYSLASSDVNTALNTYNTIQGTRNATSALGVQQQGMANQQFLQNNQQSLAKYGMDQNATWNKYLADLNKHQQLTQGVSSTVNGLAFLYGFKGQGGGGSGSTPTSYGGTAAQAPSQYNFGVPNSYPGLP